MRFVFSALFFPLQVLIGFLQNVVKVTFVYGQEQGKCKIPHTSGSFDQLKTLAKEIFQNLEKENIYFVNDETEIRNAYDFNIAISSRLGSATPPTFGFFCASGG